jgi:hypothetical protein
MTISEEARHARAELEVIAAGLPLRDLVRLLRLGRRLAEQDADGAAVEVAVGVAAYGEAGTYPSSLLPFS